MLLAWFLDSWLASKDQFSRQFVECRDEEQIEQSIVFYGDLDRSEIFSILFNIVRVPCKYTWNVEVVEEEKDLGVLITNDLKASQQCTAACNLGMMNRTIVYKSKEVLLNLYKSLVRPHVEYCTPVWSPCYQKDKSLIERVQHRFTRMIPGFSKLPYCERLKRLGLWSLEERHTHTVY